MIFLLFVLASSISIENTEDSCYLLASYLLREKLDVINAHLRQHPGLKDPELRLKLIEQGYTSCMARITNEQVSEITANGRREYSKYRDLVLGDPTMLTTPDSLKLSPSFTQKRIEISKRISFASRPSRSSEL